MQPKLRKYIGNREIGFIWIQTELDEIRTQNDYRISLYPLAFLVTTVTSEKFSIGVSIFKQVLNIELFREPNA